MDNRAPAWWLGIDPARAGAAVLLDPGGVPVVAYCWRPRSRGGAGYYEVALVQEGGHQRREQVPTLGRVGAVLAASVPRVAGGARLGLAVEAPYVSRLNPGTGLGVAITTGKLVGPLEELVTAQVHVKAAEWRQELLGLHHRTPRDRCKRVSLAVVPQRLPALAGLLARVAGLLGSRPAKLDHVTDAGGVAEYGYLHGEEVAGAAAD